MKDDRVYLSYILLTILKMAESTQRLSNRLKATQPHFPWDDISGFRIILVHNYIAVHNQTLIDHDSDTLALSRRIRAKYGKTAVLMMPAAGPREIMNYSYQLIRARYG